MIRDNLAKINILKACTYFLNLDIGILDFNIFIQTTVHIALA